MKRRTPRQNRAIFAKAVRGALRGDFTIKRKPVSSSNLASAGYNPATRILEIAFKSGGAYQYHDVEPGTHKGLMKAGSKGKFFHRRIKDAYPWEKTEGVTAIAKKIIKLRKREGKRK